MNIEAILPEEKLSNYFDRLSGCLISNGLKPTKKQLYLVYDYIRYYQAVLLNSPEKSFDFIFNDKQALQHYGVINLRIFNENYGNKGKQTYIKIKLLEVEVSVLKYKLDHMHIGINY